MSDSYLPLLEAVISAMKSNTPLTSLVGGAGNKARIYNDVVDNPVFPYVVATINSQVYDTKTSEGMEHTLQISIYSRKTSTQEVGQIRRAVYNLLHNKESSLSAADVDSIMFNGLAPTFKEPDGQTWQGVIQFRVVIGE